MQIEVDHQSSVPIYCQLIEQIRVLLLTGALKPGDRLPDSRALACRLAINPLSVCRAYNQLAKEGVLTCRHRASPCIARRNGRLTASQKRRIAHQWAEDLVSKAVKLGLRHHDLVHLVLEVLDDLDGGHKPSCRR